MQDIFVLTIRCSTIDDAVCGFCGATDDYQGLANTILKFCEVKNKNEMADKGRAYYDRYFSIDRSMNSLEATLADLGELNNV